MHLGPLGQQRAPFGNSACPHFAAERVITVDGEHVGYVCPDCDQALPLGWSAFEGIPARAMDTAVTLAMCGYDPQTAVELVYGHASAECPGRVEVTSTRGAAPQYVHGCREA